MLTKLLQEQPACTSVGEENETCNIKRVLQFSLFATELFSFIDETVMLAPFFLKK